MRFLTIPLWIGKNLSGAQIKPNSFVEKESTSATKFYLLQLIYKDYFVSLIKSQQSPKGETVINTVCGAQLTTFGVDFLSRSGHRQRLSRFSWNTHVIFWPVKRRFFLFFRRAKIFIVGLSDLWIPDSVFGLGHRETHAAPPFYRVACDGLWRLHNRNRREKGLFISHSCHNHNARRVFACVMGCMRGGAPAASNSDPLPKREKKIHRPRKAFIACARS